MRGVKLVAAPTAPAPEARVTECSTLAAGKVNNGLLFFPEPGGRPRPRFSPGENCSGFGAIGLSGAGVAITTPNGLVPSSGREYFLGLPRFLFAGASARGAGGGGDVGDGGDAIGSDVSSFAPSGDGAPSCLSVSILLAFIAPPEFLSSPFPLLLCATDQSVYVTSFVVHSPRALSLSNFHL